METTFTCSQCGETKTHNDNLTTGYGKDSKGNVVCFSCCGINDEKELIELPTGKKICHYWDGKNIINWQGTLKITPYYIKKGRHNMAGTREDIYFNFKGHKFHATQYGNFSQIAYIQKLKA